METPRAGGSATLRTIIVVGLALVVLAIDLADLKRIWVPNGVFGYGTNLDGVVTGVDLGSPADRAGMRVGDRLDESTMTPQQLEELIQVVELPSAGMSRTFSFHRGAVRKVVTLTSVSEPMGTSEITIIVVECIAGIVLFGIGVAVVLLRPDLTTWGFYFFCLGSTPALTLGAGLNSLIQTPFVQIYDIFSGLMTSASTAGILLFAIRFLRVPLSGWRRVAQSVVPFVFLLLAALWSTQFVNTYVLGTPAEWTAQALQWLTFTFDLAVIATLIETYVRRSGEDRQRIRWVVLGVAIALVCQFGAQVVLTEATSLPYAVPTILTLIDGIAPLAVAYAIIKHRVIDVNFVVSRTLVYGIMTTFFVALFALIDWFVGRVLDQTRWAVVVEVGAAVAAGFWLNALHTRVDLVVDSVLFRKRHAAEKRLARLARGLPHATSPEVVDSALVVEPRDALDLSSAALFKPDGGGRFEHAAAIDWPANAPRRIEKDDLLILHLQAERGAIRLSELHRAGNGISHGAAGPVLALPVIVRHELDAIVLYGAHRGGEDIDPDEIQWLNALSVAAAAAYDHLVADALRRELEDLKRERAAEQLALHQLRISPSP